MGEKSIGTLGLLRLIARSFYLQAGWNYETLQALGFAGAMFSVGRKLASKGEVSQEFAERHLAMFNTNPVLASYIIGAVAKLEEEHNKGRTSAAEIQGLKSKLAVPLAAIGDRFFWANLRPFAGIVGVLVAGTAGVAGAVVLLAIYNVFHIYYRIKGVLRGYALGERVVVEISRLNVVKASEHVGRLGAFVLGMLLVTAAQTWTDEWRREAVLVLPVIAIASGFLPESLQKRITEIGIAVGTLGLLLTAGGVLG